MANGQHDPQLYEQFTSITGCKSNRRITQYLEACGFDLATAVDLFFAQDGDVNSSTDTDDVAMLTDDDDVQFIQSTSKNTKKTHAKMAASSSDACSSKNFCEKPLKDVSSDVVEVRAPIPSTRGQLVQHSFSEQYGTHTSRRPDVIFGRDLHSISADQDRNLRRNLNGNIASCEPEIRNSERNGSNGHVSMLQNMFRPPVDIMFVGTFEGAKEASLENGKWLLINVQDSMEFASQTLNRDIWSNSGVKELVKTNFTFWQVMSDSVDGRRLSNYYSLRSFPMIFIVDPRTGEQVFNLVLKRQDPVTICDSFTVFLDKFPDFAAHDRHIVGSDTGREQDAFGPGAVPNVAAEPECSRSAMLSQDEERSMRKRKGPEESGSSGKRGKLNSVDDALNENTRMLSVDDPQEWRQMIVPGGETCRIRLKLPDGRLETVEITENSRLKALFGFIASSNLNPHDHLFVLSFPRRLYSFDVAEQSLKSLGFTRNEMVHVELK